MENQQANTQPAGGASTTAGAAPAASPNFAAPNAANAPDDSTSAIAADIGAALAEAAGTQSPANMADTPAAGQNAGQSSGQNAGQTAGQGGKQPENQASGILANLGAGQTAQPAAQPARTAQPDPLDQPITDPANLDLGIDVKIFDQTVVDEFGALAKDLGLTPRQAAGLAQWQTRLADAARARYLAEGTAALAREWGANTLNNQRAALGLISQVDRALHGQNPDLGKSPFSDALARSGATCDANFLRGLLVLANLNSEDALGSLAPASAPHQETALEGIMSVFR